MSSNRRYNQNEYPSLDEIPRELSDSEEIVDVPLQVELESSDIEAPVTDVGDPLSKYFSPEQIAVAKAAAKAAQK